MNFELHVLVGVVNQSGFSTVIHCKLTGEDFACCLSCVIPQLNSLVPRAQLPSESVVWYHPGVLLKSAVLLPSDECL